MSALSAAGSRWAGPLCLLVTALGWGMNWPAIKVLLRDWPPLFSRGIAGVVAAMILAGIASLRGERLRIDRALLPRLCILATTNVFFWMGLSTVMMQWLSVAEGALLVYTMPIWSMLLSWPLLGVRPTGRMVTALALGIAGTATLLGSGVALGPDKVAGIAIGLSSAVLFALGGILNRKPIPLAPMPLAAWQLVLGCVPMVVLGLVFERHRIGPLGPQALLLLGYMTLVPMALCYFTWFAALRLLAPSTAAIGTLMVPPIGIVGAALTLGEPIGWRVVVALVLTLSGVAMALLAPAPIVPASRDP